MLTGGIPIGRVWGISIRLHYSWFIIFALVTWSLVASWYPSQFPNWPLSLSIAAGLITSILFFASVLLHELMHSRVAISEGLPVYNITLFVLGGVSQITEEPKKAKDEFWMALAGPATSLILGGIFFAIWYALGNSNQLTVQFISAICFWLGYINIALGAFNLIPGFPLDGGRVLRSIIWWSNNNLRRATRIASTIGRIIGFLFIFGGIYLIFTGNWFNGIWFAVIGWFLESAASNSYRQLVVQDMLKSHMAGEIMTRECVQVSPDITVQKLVNDHILETGRRCFPVISDSRIEGLVTLQNVREIPRDRWTTMTVREAMVKLENLKSVKPGDDLSLVMQIMTENDIAQVPVVQDSNIVGMIGRDNLLNFINTQNEVRA